MERKEAIRSAYRLTGGNNFYDGMITCSTLSGKAVCHLVWDMNQAECDVNCTPFVRQYDILSNKWGVLLCQKEYQTSDIRQNSKNW